MNIHMNLIGSDVVALIIDKLLERGKDCEEDVEKVERAAWDAERAKDDLVELLKKTAKKIPNDPDDETITVNWEPDYGETYYYYGDCDEIRQSLWRDTTVDKNRKKLGNIFRNRDDLITFLRG